MIISFLKPQRRQYLARVNAILASIGFSLDDLQTRARQTSFLLGSLLLPLLQIEEDHPGTYAEILSETGAYLRHVYSYRWKHRHQRAPRREKGAAPPPE